MLSVQSVNLMNQPAFASKSRFENNSYIVDVDYEPVAGDSSGDVYHTFEPVQEELKEDVYYSKKDYAADKSKLEEHLDEINSVIENTDVPKPVRALGKIVSVGIGAALGFVSMKYGAQGVAKFIKKGASWTKSLAEKPFAKNIGERTQNIIKYVKDSKLTARVSEFFQNLGEKYSQTKFAGKLSDINNTIMEAKPVKAVLAQASNLKKEALKYATAENIEKGAVNLFAFSGGVTGGVTALQEVTKD